MHSKLLNQVSLKVSSNFVKFCKLQLSKLIVWSLENPPRCFCNASWRIKPRNPRKIRFLVNHLLCDSQGVICENFFLAWHRLKDIAWRMECENASACCFNEELNFEDAIMNSGMQVFCLTWHWIFRNPGSFVQTLLSFSVSHSELF